MSENLSTNFEQNETEKRMKIKIIIEQQRGLKKPKNKNRLKSLYADKTYLSPPKPTENGTCKYCHACMPLANMKQHYLKHFLVQNEYLVPENSDQVTTEKVDTKINDKHLVQENCISSTNHVADFTNMALDPSTAAKVDSFLDSSNITTDPSILAKKDEFVEISTVPHILKSLKDDVCQTKDLTITTPVPSTPIKNNRFLHFSNTDPAAKPSKTNGTQSNMLDYTNIASTPSTSGKGDGFMDSVIASALESVKDNGSQSKYTNFTMMTPAPSISVKNDSTKDMAPTNGILLASYSAKRSKYMDFYNSDIDDVSQYDTSFFDDSLGWNFKGCTEKQENDNLKDPLPPPPFKVSVRIIVHTIQWCFVAPTPVTLVMLHNLKYFI